VLAAKCTTFVRSAYEHTRVYKTLQDFVNDMSPNVMPRAVVVGSPPMFRGTTQPGRDIELQILRAFPGVALFMEKPVATGPADELGECFKVARAIADAGAVCSVGYMLRYLRGVQMIKKILEEKELTVMATVARYACAYEAIAKPDWWDKTRSAGPVIEQGTHFCDLSRYFGGDVDISSVSAHALEWFEPPGQLSAQKIDESAIAPDNRIPRVTAATWCVRAHGY
jgi:predicted dehydrogenase